MEAIFMGIISALAILFLLLKLDIRKVLYFDLLVDIMATTTLVMIFSGTYAGMAAGIIAGAIISVTLYILRKLMGYKKPTLNFKRKVTFANFITWKQQ